MPELLTLQAPYSLELGPHDDKKAVVEGDASGIPAGKMMLVLTTTVEDTRRQAIKGSFDTLLRYGLNEQWRKGTNAQDWWCYGSWNSPSAGQIDLDNTGGSMVNGDIAIAIDSTFPNATHLIQETFDQLIAYYLEHTVTA